MTNKKGFSLLLFLLYLFLFTIITCFSCHIVVSLIIPSVTAIRTSRSIIAVHIASDLFVKDIHAMRNTPYHWKLIEPKKLIWHVNGRDIGWFFSKNCLKRVEGIYNTKWTNKITSIVATKIEKLSFIIKKNGDRIIGIELTITLANYKEKNYSFFVATYP